MFALLMVVASACSQRPTVRVSDSPTPADEATEASTSPTTSPAPTPSCTPGKRTPSSTEGPYFTRGSPEKASLIEQGIEGDKLVITGFVLDSDCKPLQRAKVDFWQADSNGDYDNQGYKLRGHVFTDATGSYRQETIATGLYSGRTRHHHVKVTPPGGQTLTTQLYFPDEPANQRDSIFRGELVMQIQDGADGKIARFDFVL